MDSTSIRSAQGLGVVRLELIHFAHSAHSAHFVHFVLLPFEQMVMQECANVLSYNQTSESSDFVQYTSIAACTFRSRTVKNVSQIPKVHIELFRLCWALFDSVNSIRFGPIEKSTDKPV